MEVVVSLQFPQLFVALMVSCLLSSFLSSGTTMKNTCVWLRTLIALSFLSAVSCHVALAEAREAYPPGHTKVLSFFNRLPQEVLARHGTVLALTQQTQTRIRGSLT